MPAKEDYVSYCGEIIRQEREILRRVRGEYHIAVDCAFTPKKWLRFHKSLSPRVTFGYSNALHEECDFALTDEVRQAFLHSSQSAIMISESLPNFFPPSIRRLRDSEN